MIEGIILIEGLNELLKAYNDYSAREFNGDPIARDDVIDNSLGVCYTACYLDEADTDERELQIDYDYANNVYECYITNEYGASVLVYREPTPIDQAIRDFKNCLFDDILHYFSEKIQDIEGYEHLSC